MRHITAPVLGICLTAVHSRRLRVTEHNILVVGRFYARIRMSRLAQLLDLPVPEAEKHLSDMVVAGALAAKIDRPAGECRI